LRKRLAFPLRKTLAQYGEYRRRGWIRRNPDGAHVIQSKRHSPRGHEQHGHVLVCLKLTLDTAVIGAVKG
jgi:hypothetical protein